MGSRPMGASRPIALTDTHGFSQIRPGGTELASVAGTTLRRDPQREGYP